MKWILVLAIMLMPIVASAASWDTIGDTISGRNDNCPINARVEVVKEIKTEVIPVLNRIPMVKDGRTQIGVAGLGEMGENFGKRGSGELIFRQIF